MSATWAADLASRIAAEIKTLRGDRSGQWLSDRTAELGHRVSRSTISELENGKRQTIGVDALIVLAAALEVSAADLLYPNVGEVENLPGQFVQRGQAVEALAGTPERIERLQAEVQRAADAIHNELFVIRKLSEAVEDMRSTPADAVKTISESILAELQDHAAAGNELAKLHLRIADGR